MDILDKITEDIKAAMLSKDKVRLETLRGIKKELLEAKTAKGGDGTVSEEMAMKIMQKMIKQRKESAEIYQNAGRQDMADGESAQAAVIAEYLPKAASEEDIVNAIKAAIATTGATSIKDMGKVIGIVSKQLAGQAEGKVIADKVKALLNA